MPVNAGDRREIIDSQNTGPGEIRVGDLPGCGGNLHDIVVRGYKVVMLPAAFGQKRKYCGERNEFLR